MESWLQDLKFSLRLLVAKPAFTFVAVLSLALGIGANTAIFTVINAVFLHPLPIADPERVVELFTRDTRTAQAGNFNLTPSSLQNFQDYRDQNSVLTGLAAYFPVGVRWTTASGETEGAPGTLTSSNYFDVLGVRPYLGRFFLPDEDIAKPVPVAVLSHSFWATKLGAKPELIGQTITLNGTPFTIVGVAPPGFKGTQTLAGADRIWMPLGMRELIVAGPAKALMTNRRFRWIAMVGRLKPDVTQTQAQAALKVIASSLAQQYPDANAGRTVEVASVSEAALGVNNRQQFVRAGGLLMTVVGFVLLIACANIANLLLAQSARREREMSVRAALGAGRARLVRQLMIESVALALAGGAAGLAVGYWGRNTLWAARPPFFGNADLNLGLDGRVLAFTAGVSIVTAVVFGLVPAIRLSRTNSAATLKLGGRSGALDLGHSRLRGVLVAAEIALATVALIGSGLFVRSLHAAETMDVGFDAAHVGFIGVNPGSRNYDEATGQQFYADAIAKARQISGVQSAAAASVVPLAGGNAVMLTVFAEGQSQQAGDRGSLILFNDVTPGYFATLGVLFRQGRDFSDIDRAGAPLVAIVNEAAARQIWPGQSALGKRFTITQRPEVYEVVGVVANHATNAVGEDPTPVIARPMRQEYATAAALIVRTAGEPGALLGAVRDQVQTLDKQMSIRNTGTIQQQIEAGLWAPRMGAALLTVFGGLALLLAMVGIYGVMSYTVAQRTPEIGVRMAFGAQPADVMRLVLRQGMRLVIAGAAVGIVSALLVARLIANLLFGINPQDPLTLVSVTSALMVVALIACYLPARRATRVDPLVALRDE